jgi:hypothetical protein
LVANNAEQFKSDVPITGLLVGDDIPNGAGSITLFAHASFIDQAQLPAAPAGSSLQLDRAYLGASGGNDKASAFCAATSARGEGEMLPIGTPGDVNRWCSSVCLDGALWRRVLPPQPGDLRIVEIYADPTNPRADNDRDWFEVVVTAAHPVDLMGLEVRNSKAGTATPRRWVLGGEACLRQESGTRVVVGGAQTAVDGVPADIQLTGGASTMFYNEAAELRLLLGDTTIDSAAYPFPVAGVSWSLDETTLAPASVWCVAKLGRTDFAGVATPGAANGSCVN